MRETEEDASENIQNDDNNNNGSRAWTVDGLKLNTFFFSPLPDDFIRR